MPKADRGVDILSLTLIVPIKYSQHVSVLQHPRKNNILLQKHQIVMSTLDIELANRNVNPSRGFALVATKINSDIDKMTTIYRLFDELSARNLLYYQAELAELEDELKQLDDDDRNAKDETSVTCQRDWRTFEIHAHSRDGAVAKAREKEKMELAMKIRDKLERYRT